MILFWVICIAMLAVALFYVLPPALRSEAAKAKDDNARRDANVAVYRDQLTELQADLRNGIVSEEQYAQDRDDIERRLLEDTAATAPAEPKSGRINAATRKHAYMMGIGLALVAVIFYMRVGTPDGITNAATPASTTPNTSRPAASGERSQAQIEANVAALAKRLQSNPSDAQGWTMLARSYGSMERFGEAAGAYAKATELTPNDADLWAEYALASAMAAGGKLEGPPTEFINRALKIDQNNMKALGLAANAAFDSKDYAKAIDYWQRFSKQLPPDSDVAKMVTSRINEAKERMAGGSQPK
ncbi:MAG TPA: c-type cytochrome biogenesis protein CcmI [Pyrinomonadaceae bacterium]|nr:c-type cytochrome biogenesis protein CcmI [Pyrinomonadaceae bacterium]